MSTKPKSRLGRGLSSLISVSDLPVELEVGKAAAPVEAPAGRRAVAGSDHLPEVSSASEAASPPTRGAAEIRLDAITPNPHQPRRRMDEASIAELAASLKSTGLVQPIIVRQVDGGYQLIAGERRWRAAKLAGLSTLPAIVRDVDSFTQAQMALVENIQREDLNPIDRAQSYRALMSQLGLTQVELASRLGEDRSSVANFLRLLDLAEPVRDLIRAGRLSLGHAKVLAGVDDILEQQRLAELVVAQELSVRNLERLVQNDRAVEPPSRRGAGATPHLQDLEKSIARQLGMRVQLRSGRKGKGRIVIHYASLDQFDELLARMGVRAE
jgi:ParB family chromosome partitioning protein